MKNIISLQSGLTYLLTSFLVLSSSSILHAQKDPVYTLDKKIALPGDGGYDYLSIDGKNDRLYVSHGSTVNVIDLVTGRPVGQIDSMQGVHGIAIASELGRGFISDGNADAVVAFDLNTLKKIRTIAIKGKGPDAIAYDAFSKRVFCFNGESDNASVIDAQSLEEAGTVSLGGGPEFAVPDGQGKMYNNLEDKNSLVIFDTRSLKVLTTYPLSPCGTPTGLAYDKIHQRIFTACRRNKGMSVVDGQSGKVITTLPIGAGVDAVAYDPDTRLVFCSCGDGTTTVIRQLGPDEYKVIQTIITQVRAKTLALDVKTHNLYLSVADFEKGTKKTIQGSFSVLVYKMQ